ncbi:2'-5' RNA ligase family protein [Actinopolyspora halophila]|uniref:2'-5' RNA ligase family protein n=1 Tax=Actinopolyspora halophila TaxID=1850 RepID=UPI0005258316|nr:2'-5' RNA ligase family protein [Actinopolyspora halophila]
MRLFTALWPSSAAVEDLSTVLGEEPSGDWTAAVDELRGFRFVPAGQWHSTLCFHGDEADSERVAASLRSGVADLLHGDPGFVPPRLRLAGAGVFRGVLWVGVVPAPEEDDGGATRRSLHRLAEAAGADSERFRPHVTVARWSGGRGRTDRLAGWLNDYSGPAWSADSLDVVASEREKGVLTYRTVQRIPLTSP